jgi:hypothetical protein
MESYHQSQPLLSSQLAEYKQSAADQESLVLAYFKRYSGYSFSPEQIQSVVLPLAPLTSARRAITNLTNRGLLAKTGDQIIGRYGRPVGTWKFTGKPRQLGLFE